MKHSASSQIHLSNPNINTEFENEQSKKSFSIFFDIFMLRKQFQWEWPLKYTHKYREYRTNKLQEWRKKKWFTRLLRRKIMKTKQSNKSKEKQGETSLPFHCLWLHFNQPENSCADFESMWSISLNHDMSAILSLSASLSVLPFAKCITTIRGYTSGPYLMTKKEISFQVTRNGRNAIQKYSINLNVTVFAVNAIILIVGIGQSVAETLLKLWTHNEQENRILKNRHRHSPTKRNKDDVKHKKKTISRCDQLRMKSCIRSTFIFIWKWEFCSISIWQNTVPKPFDKNHFM